MDNEKIGDELAEKVAAYLERYWDITQNHRDYCGVELTWLKEEDCYYYCHFYGGQPYITDKPNPFDRPLKKFRHRQGFIHWLAQQSTAALIGSPSADWHITNSGDRQSRNLSTLAKFLRG
ncbi:hypothetical protein [[Limnothrix rosea] IAM M-220]|uniref:hypothetical protein n=1 Tax=[Limnothrix rosea] IAM M-220 TaxID=454133 RepID=UPI0009689764|nr:hypothetical protein [[Limnothrix rosea] IAM M-220]OKH19061.1 hypothetical protein NIES208_03580 [[Limnothrix rosea] IAM M-220]